LNVEDGEFSNKIAMFGLMVFWSYPIVLPPLLSTVVTEMFMYQAYNFGEKIIVIIP